MVKNKVLYSITRSTFLFFVLGIQVLSAQLNVNIIGDAVDQGNNCFTITEDLEFQSGGVWFDNPIDFDEDFTIIYQNNFGSKDFNGADGMALVFKRDAAPQLGSAGGGLGYQGISPSLVVEFDTYQNNIPSEGLLGDPSFDHIAIMRNGNPFHNSADNLAGPVQASPTSQNIEDGNLHEIKIAWNATFNVFNVYFDCQLRLSLNSDIKNQIFSGDDSVFFGFVGSTGGRTNVHEVCFNSVSFVDNLQLQDDFICEGGSKVVDATIPSGGTYSWSPTNGINNPTIPNPTFAPTSTTTYTVTISDVCGNTTTEEFTLSVLPIIDPVFDPVNAICAGDNLANLPTTSNNGISGFWSPSINNMATTTYTFTPFSPCTNSTTLEIVVNPIQTPSFDLADSICFGDILSPLPTVSDNGISGTWTPALNNTATTTYTFTPEPSQLCAESTTLEITVNPIVDPLFDAVDAICEGESLSELPTTSNNGISGSWSPELDNTMTTTYTFTPNTGECATSTTLEIEVNNKVIPIFDVVDPICEGDTLDDLSLISNNGISGSWTPAINNTETTTYTFTPSDGECAFEVTLTITVIPNTIPTFNPVGTICPGQFLDELPTTSLNGITGMWSPNINNQETTLYTFTPDAGQGCVVSTTLEIIVTDPIIPTFDIIEFSCEGAFINALPTLSNNGISGTWSPELNTLETTAYTFTPGPNQCASGATWTIEVIPISELSITVEVVSRPFEENQIVEAIVTGGTGFYEFQLDNGPWVETNTFSQVTGCDLHVIRARESSGCSNIASNTFRIFDYPKFFTPNGDGFNPTWNIRCLNDQPSAIIQIFDRYGKLLKTMQPSGLGWNGTFNGALMPSNDYWFKVQFLDENGTPSVFRSHFTLKR